jgi:hypothetical protein
LQTKYHDDWADELSVKTGCGGGKMLNLVKKCVNGRRSVVVNFKGRVAAENILTTETSIIPR